MLYIIKMISQIKYYIQIILIYCNYFAFVIACILVIKTYEDWIFKFISNTHFKLIINKPKCFVKNKTLIGTTGDNNFNHLFLQNTNIAWDRGIITLLQLYKSSIYQAYSVTKVIY